MNRHMDTSRIGGELTSDGKLHADQSQAGLRSAAAGVSEARTSHVGDYDRHYPSDGQPSSDLQVTRN